MSLIQPAKIAVRDWYGCLFIYLGTFPTEVKVKALSLCRGLGCGVKGDLTFQLNTFSQASSTAQGFHQNISPAL